MSVKNDFISDINEGLEQRIEAQGNRPGIEVWPDDDGFGRWVSSHRDRVRSVICSAPEFADSPFCGRGFH